jgi:hypothetical protein
MMKLLLARSSAIMKEHKQDILARMEADKKADQAKAEDDLEKLKEMMKATKENFNVAKQKCDPQSVPSGLT